MENAWGSSTISKILRDERYTGKLVALKTSRSEQGNIDSAKAVEKEDGIVAPGAFEAIVSQETFDAAQARYAEGGPRPKPGPMERRLFYRKLRCGTTAPLWSGMRSGGAPTTPAAARQRVQKRIAQLETQKAEAYLSYDLGEISQSEYKARRKKIETAIMEQKRLLDALEQDGGNVPSEADTASCGRIASLSPLSDLRTLDRGTVEKLIRSIQVYSGERIEIAWDLNEDYMKLLIEEDTAMRDSK